MKYLVQIIVGLVPIVVWFFSIVFPQHIHIFTLDKFVTRFEIVCFIGVGVLHVFVFVFLLLKELNDRKVCYTIAQFVCILGMIVFFAYAWLTYMWMHTTQETGELHVLLDTLYGFNNIFLTVYAVLVGQFIMVSQFGKSIIPFWTIRTKKPVGYYLREMGKVTDSDIQEAIRQQKEDTLSG